VKENRAIITVKTGERHVALDITKSALWQNTSIKIKVAEDKTK
jgi:hypothetical protein